MRKLFFLLHIFPVMLNGEYLMTLYIREKNIVVSAILDN